jgi:sulfur carrier protein ThiS
MKLYAGGFLDFYLPDRTSQIVIEVKQPTRLSEILAGLGLPLAEIHLAVVNGQLVKLDEAVVTNIDQVKIYPAVNGG